MSLLRFRLVSIALLLGGICLAASGQHTIVLRGTVITPDKVITDGYVEVVGEKITKVGAFAEHPAAATIVETGGILAPGLIDLHDHITWNLLPRWKPSQVFNNRYDWQQLTSYNIALVAPHEQLVSDGLQCEMNLYGEVRAIVNGATSLVGSLSATKDDPADNQCVEGLARNLDVYSGFYQKDAVNQEKLRYEVFPFQMKDAGDAIVRLKDGRLTAFLAHVSEGGPNDASAAREFTMFRNQGFLIKGTSVVHGVALKQTQFHEMAEKGVGLIWSPRSNVELYGATADIAAAKAERVVIALAPDWGPSGSDGMLAEMKYAATWNAGTTDPATSRPIFTDTEIVSMATSHAAELAGLADKIGNLAPGMYADLIVVKQIRPDAYQSLVHAGAKDVQLVMIGGAAVYGDPALMRTMLPSTKLESVTICQTPKLLSMETYVHGKGAADVWASAVGRLRADLEQWGSSLAPLAECPSSN